MFDQGFQTDESMRPKVKCLYCLRVFGNPDKKQILSL